MKTYRLTRPCWECKGTGKRAHPRRAERLPCERCRGTGEVAVNVTVPPKED